MGRMANRYYLNRPAPVEEAPLWDNPTQVLEVMVEAITKPEQVIGMTYKGLGTTIDGIVTRY